MAKGGRAQYRSRRSTMRRVASAAAQLLFAVLRSLDEVRIKLIWVETPASTQGWDGVRDRLHKPSVCQRNSP